MAQRPPVGTWRHVQTIRPVAREAVASETVVARTISTAEVDLRDWIESEGGYIDPRISLTNCSPVSLCRGIIALEDIASDEGPVIAVPERLYLTNGAAVEQLSTRVRRGAPTGARPIAELSAVHQVVLLLAHERLRGRDSPWHSYIALLPESIPCGWAQDSAQIEQASRMFGVGA